MSDNLFLLLKHFSLYCGYSCYQLHIQKQCVWKLFFPTMAYTQHVPSTGKYYWRSWSSRTLSYTVVNQTLQAVLSYWGVNNLCVNSPFLFKTMWLFLQYEQTLQCSNQKQQSVWSCMWAPFRKKGLQSYCLIKSTVLLWTNISCLQHWYTQKCANVIFQSI